MSGWKQYPMRGLEPMLVMVAASMETILVFQRITQFDLTCRGTGTRLHATAWPLQGNMFELSLTLHYCASRFFAIASSISCLRMACSF